jgi:hypothetical protein
MLWAEFILLWTGFEPPSFTVAYKFFVTWTDISLSQEAVLDGITASVARNCVLEELNHSIQWRQKLHNVSSVTAAYSMLPSYFHFLYFLHNYSIDISQFSLTVTYTNAGLPPGRVTGRRKQQSDSKKPNRSLYFPFVHSYFAFLSLPTVT